MNFDPLVAVQIHTHGAVTIDPAVVGLDPEASLLIHSCSCAGRRQQLRELSAEGEPLLRVDFDPVLTWSVRATVLQYAGLADYHPGARLSRQGLVFANGARTPYQFLREAAGEEVGVLFYEDPDTGHEGGDTPEIGFQVTLEFSDLDTTNYPGEETTGGGWTWFVPSYVPDPPPAAGFVEIPVLSAQEITDAAKNALLRAGFINEDPFEDEDWTATLYDGEPGSGGVSLGAALPLEKWTEIDTPGLPYIARVRNQELVEWTELALTERSCTYIRWERNGIEVAVVELPEPLVIPPLYTVRAPVNALALQLTWPFDDTGNPPLEHARPAQFMIRLAVGWLRAEMFLDSGLYVEATNGLFDPLDEELFDEFTVAASPTFWSVSGLTVTPTGITGVNTAPVGGWPVEGIEVSFFNEGPAGCYLMRRLTSIAVAEGDAVELSGAPVLNLADPPVEP